MGILASLEKFIEKLDLNNDNNIGGDGGGEEVIDEETLIIVLGGLKASLSDAKYLVIRTASLECLKKVIGKFKGMKNTFFNIRNF